MIVVDVNVLVAAHLVQHPHHGRAYNFLIEALGKEAVLVPDTVWSGFLRIVTNSRIFEEPSTPEEAIGFLRAVVAAPRYRHVSGLIDGLEPFLEMIVDSTATGGLVRDAYIATFARVNGCSVATFDRDFRRFDGIDVRELA